MRLLMQIIRYYRAPGNRRRLIGSCVMVVIMLMGLYHTLTRTYWYGRSGGAPSGRISSIVFFLLLLCVAGAIWIVRKVNAAPLWVRILELAPAGMVCLVMVAVDISYHLQLS